MKCYVIYNKDNDDQYSFLSQILENSDFIPIKIYYTSYNEMISILLQHPSNLIFVDIDVVKDFGLLSSELYRLQEEFPKLIAMSNSKIMAYETIKSDYIDFLLKPFDYLELKKAICKLQKEIRSLPQDQLCIKTYSDYHFLNFKDILFLQADSNATDIYTTFGKKLSIIKSLKHFEEELPARFHRIHNSYIVNIDLINRINFGKSHVYLQHDDHSVKIPFSKSYRQKVHELKTLLAKEDIYF